MRTCMAIHDTKGNADQSSNELHMKAEEVRVFET